MCKTFHILSAFGERPRERRAHKVIRSPPAQTKKIGDSKTAAAIIQSIFASMISTTFCVSPS